MFRCRRAARAQLEVVLSGTPGGLPASACARATTPLALVQRAAVCQQIDARMASTRWQRLVCVPSRAGHFNAETTDCCEENAMPAEDPSLSTPTRTLTPASA
jgi:hypothetical protein